MAARAGNEQGAGRQAGTLVSGVDGGCWVCEMGCWLCTLWPSWAGLVSWS
jgi:hypothetical protein